MSNYISSNENRFYVVREAGYGTVSAASGGNRIPAVKLTAKHQLDRVERRDKTGGRTFVGVPPGTRHHTSYELTTYMTGWSDQANDPAYGPLFEAALGGQAQRFAGAAVASVTGGSTIHLAAATGLNPGQGVTFGSEIRFVSAIPDAQTIQLNAPFTLQPGPGAQLGTTVTYQPETNLPSVSIFDYWSPSSSVQRILSGAAVNRLRVKVNGDFHQFEFSGPARDLIDSSSFTGNQAGLSEFPPEPLTADWDYAIVPGHLGQAWLGSTPEQFFTLTSADLLVDNALDVRSREFGSSGPMAVSPGKRTVSLSFSLFERDDDVTKALYEAARQRSPISAMFQLGQQQGQLVGIYMSSVVPEVPEFDDSEHRLQWNFASCRAQGTINDEITIAFG
jgi:hypothetical protein